jgi:hypothetical protein
VGVCVSLLSPAKWQCHLQSHGWQPLAAVGHIILAVAGNVVQVGDYDPDLTMLLATILLLAFEIVTPTQGVQLCAAAAAGGCVCCRSGAVAVVPRLCSLRVCVVVVVVVMVTMKMVPPRVESLSVCLAGCRAVGVGVGVVSPAWAGFSNTGVITVAAMFIIAKCIEVNGTVDFIARVCLGKPRSLISAQFRHMAPTAMLSAFIPNTPLVATMIPILASWTTRIGVSAAQVMIPLSFASMVRATAWRRLAERCLCAELCFHSSSSVHWQCVRIHARKRANV